MTTWCPSWRRLAAPGIAGNVAAALAGALVPLSLAPLNWWPLGIASAAVLAWLLGSLPPLSAAVRGFCYGFAQFGVGASWIYVSVATHGVESPLLAATITTIFCAGWALFCCALPWWLWRRLPLADDARGLLWAFPAVWVLGEWMRCWLFTGFPWLLVGYGHLDTPLAGWAPVGGVLAVSFAVALSGAALLCLKRGGPRATALIVLALLWGGGTLLRTVEWTRPSPKTAMTAALVQANIPIEFKWRKAQREQIIARYRELSAPLWSEYELVVWPETALPNWYPDSRDMLHESSTLATTSSATLFSGIAERHRDFNFYNSIWALGSNSGSYHKRHLVPYGEYWPLADWLNRLLPFMDLSVVGYSAGAERQPLLQTADHIIAPYICYEIVFPDLVREAPGRGAEFLLTVSEDAWFGRSLMPHQHMQMAQMRALENSRALLRSTNSGISALVDHRGRLVRRGGLFQSEVVSGKLAVREGLTPFSRFGSLPILLLCAVLLATGTAGGVRAGRKLTEKKARAET